MGELSIMKPFPRTNGPNMNESTNLNWSRGTWRGLPPYADAGGGVAGEAPVIWGDRAVRHPRSTTGTGTAPKGAWSATWPQESSSVLRSRCRISTLEVWPWGQRRLTSRSVSRKP